MASERRLGGACELHEAIAGTAVLLCCPGGLRCWLAECSEATVGSQQWRACAGWLGRGLSKVLTALCSARLGDAACD